MSTGALIAIVILAIIVIAALVVAMAAARRRRLQQRFGPEYDRAVGEGQSQLKAEAELASRERRVRGLDIRPLSTSARASYAARWTDIQEQFVDQPQDAVATAQFLVTEVMRERGYPTDDHDQILADLSVEHASTLEHYRSAHAVSHDPTEGATSTEDLRQAMIHYRALFSDLLGDPDGDEADKRGDPDARTEARTPLAEADSALAGDPAVAEEPALDEDTDSGLREESTRRAGR